MPDPATAGLYAQIVRLLPRLKQQHKAHQQEEHISDGGRQQWRQFAGIAETLADADDNKKDK